MKETIGHALLLITLFGTWLMFWFCWKNTKGKK